MPARHPHPIPLGGFLARSGLTDRHERHTVGTWSRAGRRFGESASARCSTGWWTGFAWERDSGQAR
jgi:hypothetical protein